MQACEAGEVDETLFAPPAPAEERPGCSDLELPTATEKPRPVYPPAAKHRRATGVVSILAVVQTDGTLQNGAVVRSAGADLDQASLEAVSRWRYRAAQCNGVPVPHEIVLDIRYDIVQ